jgi:hypothetical protein
MCDMSKGHWLKRGYKIDKDTGEIDWDSNPSLHGRRHKPYGGHEAEHAYGTKRKQHRSRNFMMIARRARNKATRQTFKEEDKRNSEEDL